MSLPVWPSAVIRFAVAMWSGPSTFRGRRTWSPSHGKPGAVYFETAFNSARAWSIC